MARNDRILAIALCITVFAVGTIAVASFSMNALGAWVQGFAALATAAASIVLAWFTKVLASETKRLADTGSQPMVVVTFGPSRHTMNFLEVCVENTGTASAYNIKIEIDPPLEIASRNKPDREFPIQKISILKSKQTIFSSLASWPELRTKKFKVTTSWQRQPSYSYREYLEYEVDLNALEGMSRLGGDPEIEIANALKNISDTLQLIGRGRSKLSVDVSLLGIEKQNGDR